MLGDIWDYITDFFGDLTDIDFSSSDILSSPRFWIALLIGGGAVYYTLTQWQGKVPGITGYYFVGAVAVIAFAYFLTARSIDKDG